MDEEDYLGFIARLSRLVEATKTRIFAWALLPNHFHLLMQTGRVPIGRVMARLLTGHAVTFNLRHRRSGKLYQNRFKSIICDEEEYLLELVRYIHLNPLRAGLVQGLEGLGRYPWCGHGVLMGRMEAPWQATDQVLARFGERVARARKGYEAFVTEGIRVGHRPELAGGGLLRSVGGVVEYIRRRRQGEEMLGDERILGDSGFVERVLKESEEWEDERSRKRRSLGVVGVIAWAAKHAGIDAGSVKGAGKVPAQCRARALACYWLVDSLGLPEVAAARHLQITQSAVSRSIARGREIVVRERIKLADR